MQRQTQDLGGKETEYAEIYPIIAQECPKIVELSKAGRRPCYTQMPKFEEVAAKLWIQAWFFKEINKIKTRVTFESNLLTLDKFNVDF